MTLGRTLMALARQSLTEPRAAAANLIALDLPMSVVWSGFFVVNIISVILGQMFLGSDTAPFVVAAFTIVFSLFSVALVVQMGRFLGGTGQFREALMLTAFLQGVFLVGQAIQILLMIILPPLAGTYGIFLLLFVAWINVNFIAALHGMASLWRAFGVLMLASFVLAMIAIFFLSMTGQLPEPSV